MDIYIKLFEVLFPVFFIVGIGYLLGKKNRVNPREIAEKIKNILSKEFDDFSIIEIAVLAYK